MGTPEGMKQHEITSRKMLPTLSKYSERISRCLQKIIASAYAQRCQRTSLFLYLYNESCNYTLFMLGNISKSLASWDQRERGSWPAESDTAEDNFLLRKKWFLFYIALSSRKGNSFRANSNPKWICSELGMLESSLIVLNSSYHIYKMETIKPTLQNVCEDWQNEYLPYPTAFNIWKRFSKCWLVLNFHYKECTSHMLEGPLVCAGQQAVVGNFLWEETQGWQNLWKSQKVWELMMSLGLASSQARLLPSRGHSETSFKHEISLYISLQFPVNL